MGLIKPDWNKFVVNSKGDPREYFEWLCYLLFCKKYNKLEGINRYINQKGIENDPIEVEEKVIGFQAKFYDTKLSEHKQEIINMLETISKSYPNLNTLIFYCNKDWGQSRESSIASKIKIEIDEFALNKNIEIIWNTEFYFESLFVVEENKEFMNHFFGDKNILDNYNQIKELNTQYKENIKLISNELIEREEYIQLLEKIKNKNIILHGKAGMGKSGSTMKIIKELEEKDYKYIAIKLDNRIPKANSKSFGKSLGLYSSIVESLNDISPNNKCYIILDQLDALRWTQHHSREALDVCQEMIREVDKFNKSREEKIILIFCSRTYDIENDNSIKHLLENSREMNWEKYEIGNIKDGLLQKMIGKKNYNMLSTKSKSLLKQISNLYIWNQLEDDIKSSEFKTVDELIKAWWIQLKKLSYPNIDEKNLDSFKTKLVNIMMMDEQLNVNSSRLDNRNEIDYLISNGFLIESDNFISFFHQSIYDFFLVEKMLREIYYGDNISKILGKKENQTPMKRYQLQMLLEKILKEDNTLFISVGKDLLKSDDIRFYMKYVLFEVLNQLDEDDITKDIEDFLLELLSDDSYLKHLMNTSFENNIFLIEFLIDKGYLNKWLEDEKKRDITIRLIGIVWQKNSKKLLEFIKEYFEEENNFKIDFSVIFNEFEIEKDTDEQFEIRLDFYNKYPEIVPDMYHIVELFKKNNIRGIKLVKTLLKNKLNNNNFGEIDLNDISDSPEENINLLFELISSNENYIRANEWRFKSFSLLVEEFIFLILKNSTEKLAIIKPNIFFDHYRNYFCSDNKIINSLILSGLNKIPIEYSDKVIKIIIDNFDNLIYDYFVSDNDKFKLIGEVIERHSKNCNESNFKELENKIYRYIDKELFIDYKRRYEYYDMDILINNKKYLYGKLQYRLLPKLDRERVGKNTKELIGVLNRKFVDYELPKGVGMAKFVGTSLDKSISDKELIKLMQREQTKKVKDIERENCFIENSMPNLASTIGRWVKQNTNKYVEILLNDNYLIKEIYIKEILSGLAYSEKLKEVDTKLIENLIIKYNNIDISSSICEIIEKNPEFDWSNKTLEILKNIAENHPDPEDDYYVTDSKTGKDIMTTSINTVRSKAGYSISSLLFKNKNLYDFFKDTIFKLSEDKNLSVKLSSIGGLLAMSNLDRKLSYKKIINMLLEHPILLLNLRYNKLPMTIYINGDAEDKSNIGNIILEGFNLEEKEVIEISGLCIAEIFIRDNYFNEVLTNKDILSKEQASSIIKMLAVYLKEEEFKEKAKRELLEFAKNENFGQIVFDEILLDDRVDIDRDSKFLVELVKNEWKNKNIGNFIYYLERNGLILINYKEIIISMCKQILIEENRDYYSVDYYLPNLLVKLYDESVDIKDISTSQICLDLWDEMYEKGIGNIRELSREIIDR